MVGSFLVRKLYVYFKRNYDCQRQSFLKALSLVIISLIFINIRYALEYVLIEKNVVVYHLKPADVKKLLVVLAFCDFMPFICMIACIQIGSKGKWDAILSA